MEFMAGLMLGILIGVALVMVSRTKTVAQEMEHTYPLAEVAREVMVGELPAAKMHNMAREALDIYEHKNDTHNTKDQL